MGAPSLIEGGAVARYEVNATDEAGTSGEGPFYYTADSPEQARQQYIDWSLGTYGDLYHGPGLPQGGPFPVITVTEVT